MATAQEKATPNNLSNNPTASNSSAVPSSWAHPAADPFRNRPPVSALMSAVDSFPDPPPKTTSTTKGIHSYTVLLIYLYISFFKSGLLGLLKFQKVLFGSQFIKKVKIWLSFSVPWRKIFYLLCKSVLVDAIIVSMTPTLCFGLWKRVFASLDIFIARFIAFLLMVLGFPNYYLCISNIPSCCKHRILPTNCL